MEAFPPIYVISLPRSHERRRSIQRRLDALGRDYEMVDAVDGEAVDWSRHTPRLRHIRRWILLGRKLIAGEIGCYLSHYALWQRMVAEQTECALVLEDDASWDEDFAGIVMQVMTVPWHWDVVALAQTRRVPLDCVVCPLDNNRRLVRHLQRGESTAAYLVRLQGAKKLCAYGRDMTLPVDCMYECWWGNGVVFYRVDPTPARHDEGYENSVAWKNHKTRRHVPLYRKLLTVGMSNKLNNLAAIRYARRHPPQARAPRR